MNLKICKGCPQKGPYCAFIEANIEDKCPCIECLIKVMCNKTCDLRNEAYVGDWHINKKENI